MFRLPSSTAFRFAAWSSAAFTVVILILGAAIYWAIRSELRYELDQRVLTAREAVLRESSAGGRSLATIVGLRSGRQAGDMRYALLDARGARIAGQPFFERPHSLGWSAMDFAKPDGERDKTWVIAERVAGGATLIIGADPEALEELDERMIPLFVGSFGVIAAIGIGGAFLLSRLLQGRLDAINTTAEAIIAGDLSRRITLTGSGDEFDRLSNTLNRMLERIAGLMDNLRQVSGDIAHDLRTPLTRVRQKLEVAQAGPDDAASLKVAIQLAIERADDMLCLFAGILAISEIEGGGAGARMAPFDFSALVADLADSYQPSAEDTGRTLSCDITPGICIDGNRELLAQAGVNLLDNALRHTPVGRDIAISLTERNGAVEFAVSDRGPGIPVADRARVFSRFTRLESSRSSPGHGLGLSLVAAVARTHGGIATLHDNQPGAIFMLTLPRKPR